MAREPAAARAMAQLLDVRCLLLLAAALHTIVVVVGSGAAVDLEAGLTISGPWGDNMVLQTNHYYGQRAFMSGTAEPGSHIVIVAPMREDKGSDIETTADEQGYWKVTLEPVQASMATHNISISGTTPKGTTYPTQTAHGVRYGEVIICGGQSNMDRVVAYDVDNGTAEIAASTEYPNIFLWTQAGVRPVPLSDSNSRAEASPHISSHFETGNWLQASPATVANYSAVCYEMARQLVDRRLTKDSPVGLVWTAVGGTPVQLWMPHDSFAAPGCDQIPNATLKDSSLFNSIIAPLTNYSHRGVVWFQGEANVDGHARWLGDKYGACFQAMIAGWRAAFGIGDFSFVFVQLAPYLNGGNITEVRLQQATALPAPGIGRGTKSTGMVTTIDKGDIYGGVHSHHKAPVAERAALAFMHVAYALQPGGLGGLEAFRGPVVANATLVAVGAAPGTPTAATTVPVKVALRFDEVGAGLHFGNTTSCGLKPNHADKHWIQNRTAVNNTNCSDGIDLSVLAKSIACCCASPGNASFFLCAGADKTSVRISDPAAGCHSAKGTISGLDEVTLEASMPSDVAERVRLSGVALRVALMAVDQPGCALYSSFGLPTPPTFVTVDTANAVAAQRQQAEASSPQPVVNPTFNARPPMGYNTWNAIHTNVDENLILQIAHVMKATNLSAAGFEYVNIDDGWEVDRDAEGRLTPDPVRFPSGLKAVSDAVHALGLKFGVYTATHEFTCQHRPGSWMHEAIDGKLFCDNLVDFIKIDTCGGRSYNSSTGSNPANGTTPNLVAYQRFRAALEVCKAETHHEIVEHCTSYDWNPELPNPCNVVDAQNGCPHPPDVAVDGGGDSNGLKARAGLGDIQANFASIVRILDNSEPCMAAVDGPKGLYGGHWLDFDMLEVGNPGLNPVESRSHFTIWAGACSTLLIGTDITDPKFPGSDAHTILTNKELIDALSQDPLGVPIKRTREPKLAPPGKTSSAQLWSKPLADGGVGVVLFNRGEVAVEGWAFVLSDVGLPQGTEVNVRDLWAHSDNGTSSGGTVAAQVVAPHGVAALRLTPVKQ